LGIVALMLEAAGSLDRSAAKRSNMRTPIARLVRRLPAAFVVMGCAAALPLVAAKGPVSAVPAHPDDKTIIHVLNRIGFGPRPGDVEGVRAVGLQTYIDQQLHPERVQDPGMAPRLGSLDTLSKSSREIAEEYLLPGIMLRRQQQRQQAQAAPSTSDTPAPPNGETQNPAAQGAQPGTQGSPALTPREMRTPEQMQAGRAARSVMTDLSEQKILRATYSERQLEEVMVDFWFNHFNVFAGKGATRGYLTEYERDAIRPHVLGKFRELLQATAESPAMLFFLDNWQNSAAADAQTMAPRRDIANRPNALRPGTRRPAAFPRPQQPAAQQAAQNRRPRGINENYARELMELHTLGVDGGYTQKDVQEVARAFTGWTIQNPRLGGGFLFESRFHDDGDKLILGHRIKGGGGKHDGEQVLDILAAHPSTAHFISTKLARRFVSDNPPKALVDRAAKRFHDTEGDIREVVRTIITSPEFFSGEAYRAKVKTPFEFVVSAMRATGTETATGLPVAAALRNLGMPLYMCQPPTGYADRAEAWVNTGALLARMNFAVSLTSLRFRGARTTAGGTVDPATARDALVSKVLGGDLSPETTATIARAEQLPQAIALVLGSPEFQKR
jgi:uncharacterized protein (DUF1800 family)